MVGGKSSHKSKKRREAQKPLFLIIVQDENPELNPKLQLSSLLWFSLLFFLLRFSRNYSSAIATVAGAAGATMARTMALQLAEETAAIAAMARVLGAAVAAIAALNFATAAAFGTIEKLVTAMAAIATIAALLFNNHGALATIAALAAATTKIHHICAATQRHQQYYAVHSLYLQGKLENLNPLPIQNQPTAGQVKPEFEFLPIILTNHHEAYPNFSLPWLSQRRTPAQAIDVSLHRLCCQRLVEEGLFR